MPGTFSQLYVQIVFAVKYRQSLIHPSWEESLFKYISGIISKKEQKPLAINGMADHIHILVGLNPACSISDLVREIKKSSNEFIKRNNLVKGKFSWQNGYGAFSYSHSDLGRVIADIQNQKQHHQKQSFQHEYKEFLNKFQVEYRDEYLFEWID